ncbi:hypothetical protein BHE74_00038388 [Ensete ventricosum]|nr:hypothetical protein BHE74_00038388 [Ensete ventricosum]
MCRPVKPEPSDRTTHKKVVRFPTFVVGRRPADSETDSGGEIVAAPTLTEAKTRHKQVPGRGNLGSSTLAQKDDESLRTLASTGDGGPEDAPKEPASGSLRLAPPDPGDPDATRRVRGGHSDLFKKHRLKGRWVAKGVRGRSRRGAE